VSPATLALPIFLPGVSDIRIKCHRETYDLSYNHVAVTVSRPREVRSSNYSPRMTKDLNGR